MSAGDKLAGLKSSATLFCLQKINKVYSMIKSNLAILLAERKLKMSDLAKETGINRGTIQRIYHDEVSRIEIEVMDKLCAFFDCTPCDLFTYERDSIQG